MAALADERPPTSAPGLPRLRLGYLSSDLRDHPVGHLFASALTQHDRSAIEVPTARGSAACADGDRGACTAGRGGGGVRGRVPLSAAHLLAAMPRDLSALCESTGACGGFSRRRAQVFAYQLGRD
jgi:hypothetical protein